MRKAAISNPSSLAPSPLNIHATCISLHNKGILIIGPSGSGKSDLALRAIMQKQAKLIADDRVDITLKNNKIYASCPPTIKNLLEVRGLGVINISTSHKSQVTVYMIIELVDKIQKIDRLPEPEFAELFGIKIKKIKLYPFELSSLDKLELASKISQ